jgi:hypothetical protein
VNLMDCKISNRVWEVAVDLGWIMLVVEEILEPVERSEKEKCRQIKGSWPSSTYVRTDPCRSNRTSE